MFRFSAVVLIAAVLSLTLFTYVALESGDVLVVETVHHTNGESRQTHIWYIFENDQLILEAGNPTNPWVKDVQLQSEVVIVGDNLDGRYQLAIAPNPSGHTRIRSLMREKYGWRDAWISMLFDTSNSMLVEATRRSE